MADIIELEKRRKDQQIEKLEALLDEKVHLLKKILQCARCQLKCSRCGTQIQGADDKQLCSLPYPLCGGCGGEYEVYQKRSKGETTAQRYWHNEEWMEVWRTWLQHQEVIDRYRNSKEFVRLLNELESKW